MATEDDLAHARNKAWVISGTALNGIKRELTLLQDGLDALKDHRFYVAVDHVERVVQGLTDLCTVLQKQQKEE